MNGGRPLKLHIPFWGVLLGGSNEEKWCDHVKKKFFINNFVKTVVLFKEYYQGLAVRGMSSNKS